MYIKQRKLTIMKKAVLIATGIIGLAIVACKKNDNGKAATNVELITSTTWSIDTIGFDNDANGQIDNAVPGGFKSCELDNTIKFSQDSTGVFDEGATKCNTTDPQSTPLTWYFKDSAKVIHIDGNLQGQLAGDAKILALTNTSFILTKVVTITTPVMFTSNLIIALKK
jgi:hypothetical protein